MESVWRHQCDIKGRPALEQDLDVETAIIGGGMAGILIADALQQSGHQVVVLEADRIAGGQTQNTTAKITAQHGLKYAKLIHEIGSEAARQYAEANQDAIQAFREMIESRNISCNFEEKRAYLYGDHLAQLQEETEAAASLGLPASLVHQVPIPLPCAGSVCFDGQAQFNPLQFLQAVSRDLTIFEGTSVQIVEDNVLKTEHHTIRAEHIVFATHYPFVNIPGLYFARMHQERSYVLALKHAELVDGMFIGAGENSYSLRTYEDMLLFGGENHRTGKNQDGGRYDALRQKANELFPHSREVAHWSAQDCITADGVPYIGRYSHSHSNWYVATGFQKWGMTSSMVSAIIIRDLICGKDNPWIQVFDPGRFHANDLPGVAVETGQAIKGLTKLLFQIPSEEVEHLPNGHGGVVFFHGKKMGVYKEDDGSIHAVELRCPHLGCQVEWNQDERSWDCPCHGSRFDYFGQLISGPAQKDITK